MGKFWLHDLPEILDGSPFKVSYYDGWELRSRLTGGFDDIRAIGIHHTASSPSTTTAQAVDRLWKIAPLRPVSNIYLGRDASITVGAAGAANTMGKGGPVPTSRGVIPLDAGNRFMIAIEAGNNGIGEVWPQRMIDAYLWLCARLCDGYHLDIARDIYGHHGWCQPSCPGRKIDPRGPTPGYPTLGPTPLTIWSDETFRGLVAATTNQEEDEMQTAIAAIYEADLTKLAPGHDKSFALLPNGQVRHAAGPDVAYATAHDLPKFPIEGDEHYNQLVDAWRAGSPQPIDAEGRV